MNKPFCWFVKLSGWVPYKLAMRPKYHYEDRSRQGRRIHGKAIVMPIHYKIWDVAALMHTFPTRNLRCVVAEVMYKDGFMKLFLPALGCIRVDRDNADFGFVSQANKVLSEGGVVEIFPESRLPRVGEQSPLPFKPSIVYIALENDAPIIPVVHNGAYLQKERMQIMIGAPICVTELYDDNLSEQENIAAITEYLRKKIVELKHELSNRCKEK